MTNREAYRHLVRKIRLAYQVTDCEGDPEQSAFEEGLSDGYVLALDAILASALGKDWKNAA